MTRQLTCALRSDLQGDPAQSFNLPAEIIYRIAKAIARTCGGRDLLNFSKVSKATRKAAKLAGRAELRAEKERLHSLSPNIQPLAQPNAEELAAGQPIYLLQSCLTATRSRRNSFPDKDEVDRPFLPEGLGRDVTILECKPTHLLVDHFAGYPASRMKLPFLALDQGIGAQATALTNFQVRRINLGEGRYALLLNTEQEKSFHLLSRDQSQVQASILIDDADLRTIRRENLDPLRGWTSIKSSTLTVLRAPSSPASITCPGPWALCYRLHQAGSRPGLFEVHFVHVSLLDASLCRGRLLLQGPNARSYPFFALLPPQAQQKDDPIDWQLQVRWKPFGSQPWSVLQISLADLLRITGSDKAANLAGTPIDTHTAVDQQALGQSNFHAQVSFAQTTAWTSFDHLGGKTMKTLSVKGSGSYWISPDGLWLLTTFTEGHDAHHLQARRRQFTNDC